MNIESWSCEFQDAKGKIVAAAQVSKLGPGHFNVVVVGGKKPYNKPMHRSLAAAKARAANVANRYGRGVRPYNRWREG